MTRGEVFAKYTVEGGRIQDPGRFEGEPPWVPYYWNIVLQGGADENFFPWGEENPMVSRFRLDASDMEVWPELEGVKEVSVWQAGDGHIFGIAVNP